MPLKDHYLVLGVRRSDSQDEIRSAYLDLVRQCHPDLAGEAGTPRFREVTEAYQILSDPQRRHRHNRQLDFYHGRESATRHGRVRSQLFVRPPLSILRDFERVGPSRDALVDRLRRNFTAMRTPKGERVEGLNIEVVLSPGEAARGGVLPVQVPCFRRCSACRGTGRDWLFPCWVCREQGTLEYEAPVQLRIQPGVCSGSVYEVPLTGLGIHNFVLRVHVCVE